MDKQATGLVVDNEAALIPSRRSVYNARMNKRTDRTLALLKRSPEQGLEMLVDQYAGYVYTIVRGRLGSFTKQDIEECVSDVFYSVYKNRNRIDEQRGTLKAFVCTVAKRKAIDSLRKLSKMEIYKKDPIRAADYAHYVSEEKNVQETVFENDQRERLIEAVKNLPEIDAQIVIRRYYLGQSNKEIARELDMKENTVSKRGVRALGKLGEILDREDFYQ